MRDRVMANWRRVCKLSWKDDGAADRGEKGCSKKVGKGCKGQIEG